MKRKPRGGEKPPPAPEPAARRPGVTVPPLLLALGAAIFLMVGFAGGYMVAVNVGPERGAQAPAPEASAQVNPELVVLGERLRQNPNDVQALLRLAHLHLDQGQNDVARGMYQHVLQIEARNVEAITHLGNVAAAEGQVDEALRRYDEALAIDPKYLHALWDKAITLQDRKGNPRAAVPVWEAFLKVIPAGSADARNAQAMLAEARQGRPTGAAPPAPEAGAREPAVQTAGLQGPAAQGRALYERLGCPRCHAIAGRGGGIGPDLTRAGAKPGRDLAWHIRHLKDPASVVPGSIMPPAQGASDAELRAVAEYVLSLK
ncbi:MAG TPA: tetratricopeptide repeat protein [Candidatus Sulfotelmatobacter sp.]|nr:tetratricopeptide repeat protein [Candidatus Sulfotelmatobacter sp.]